jgi:hypothetical protein
MTIKSSPPIRRLLTQIEAKEILGEQVFLDAFAAGWIKPRARKKGRGGKSAKVIYALSDVRHVEERILNNEYPEPAA